MSEGMDDMIKMLADQPEEQRQAMVTERLKMISGQPDEQRVQSVKGIVMGASKLNEKKWAGFIASRTNAIMGLEPEARKAILVARVKVGKEVPEPVNKTDFMYTVKAAMRWPEEKRKMFIDNIGMIFDNLGMPRPDFQAMMMKLKGGS
ncbi:MAG: hypothetical protein ACW99U_05200 [Candidatus Thorarchaeota archaeon]|jgi:hypothetical protein